MSLHYLTPNRSNVRRNKDSNDLPHLTKDENIDNEGYIGTSILRIYWGYISVYFGKKNINKPKIDQNSWKCKKNLIEI